MTTLVLGLGDLEGGEDGFGPRAVAELQRRYDFDPAVTFVDAETVGVRLLPVLAGVDHLLVMALVRLGRPAGTLHRLEWAESPQSIGARLPAIRAGVEILRTLHFWVDPPPELVVLGVEGVPVSQLPRRGMSPPVAAALPEVIHAAAEELRRWGHLVLERRATAATAGAAEDSAQGA